MSNDDVQRDPHEDPEKMQEELTSATAEVEALRTEVEELRSYKAAAEAEGARPQRHRWRRVVIVLLIVLGCVAGAGANVTVWLKNVALNTNAWVAAVGPLSRDPAVALAVSDYVVKELTAGAIIISIVSTGLNWFVPD